MAYGAGIPCWSGRRWCPRCLSKEICRYRGGERHHTRGAEKLTTSREAHVSFKLFVRKVILRSNVKYTDSVSLPPNLARLPRVVRSKVLVGLRVKFPVCVLPDFRY